MSTVLFFLRRNFKVVKQSDILKYIRAHNKRKMKHSAPIFPTYFHISSRSRIGRSIEHPPSVETGRPNDGEVIDNDVRFIQFIPIPHQSATCVGCVVGSSTYVYGDQASLYAG